jgi:two-component system, OmpR family, response regulator
MRLLYVEDNRLNALLFEEMLNAIPDIELRVAEQGQEAMQLAMQWQPELLVLDARLPDTSGLDLLPRMRALPGLETVPAYMCSADTSPEDIASARRAGFEGYWVKPVNIQSVIAALKSLAGKPSEH